LPHRVPSGTPPRTFSPAAINALLLGMVVIWGVNYSIVKLALREIPPIAFNALRMTIASGIFLGAIFVSRPREASNGPFAAVTGAEWVRIVALAAIGHAIYQMCFISGLARTSVSNSSLIIGCSPVAVALLAAASGHERPTRWHWAGCAVSVLGIYLIASGNTASAAGSITGDLLMIVSISCWAIYTVGSRGLLQRHSPLFVTGVTMAIGTAFYLVAFATGELRTMAWTDVTPPAWAAVLFSAVFALFVAYLIWYTGVQQIGNARTSVYSNMVPVFGVTIAVIWLGEPIDTSKLVGAVAVLLGVALTRIGRAPIVEEPAE
jgi:drug/metabolite transporter (DMT)-like permease